MPLPPCSDATAYAALLSIHNASSSQSTALAAEVASSIAKGKGVEAALATQLRLLGVLVRSLRGVERSGIYLFFKRLRARATRGGGGAGAG